MAGADPKSVQKIYGHSKLETAEVYPNVIERHLDKTMDLVELSDRDEKWKVINFKKAADFFWPKFVTLLVTHKKRVPIPSTPFEITGAAAQNRYSGTLGFSAVYS